MKEAIVGLGEFLTVGGILLVVTADLVTPLARVRHYAETTWAKTKGRALGLYYRLRRRQRPPIVVRPESIGLNFGAGTPRVTVFPGENATIQQVITYLSTVEERLSTVETDLPRLIGELREELAKAQAELERLVAASIAAEAGRFGKQRLLGTACLIAGSGLLGYANFL